MYLLNHKSKKMKKIAIIFLLLLGIQGMGYGQSLEEYLKTAAENNPELKA